MLHSQQELCRCLSRELTCVPSSRSTMPTLERQTTPAASVESVSAQHRHWTGTCWSTVGRDPINVASVDRPSPPTATCTGTPLHRLTHANSLCVSPMFIIITMQSTLSYIHIHIQIQRCINPKQLLQGFSNEVFTVNSPAPPYIGLYPLNSHTHTHVHTI